MTPCGFVRVLLRGEEVAEVMAPIARRVTRLITRRGLSGSPEHGEGSDLSGTRRPFRRRPRPGALFVVVVDWARATYEEMRT